MPSKSSINLATGDLVRDSCCNFCIFLSCFSTYFSCCCSNSFNLSFFLMSLQRACSSLDRSISSFFVRVIASLFLYSTKRSRLFLAVMEDSRVGQLYRTRRRVAAVLLFSEGIIKEVRITETFNSSQLLSREDLPYLGDYLELFRFFSSCILGGISNGWTFWSVLAVCTLKKSQDCSYFCLQFLYTFNARLFIDLAFSIRFFSISSFFSNCYREFMFLTLILKASYSSIARRNLKWDSDYFFDGSSPRLRVVSFLVLVLLSGRECSLIGVPKVMVFLSFAHYFWRVASCMAVKLKLERLPQLLANFSIFSKSSTLPGRPILTAACTHSSRQGIKESTIQRMPSLSLAYLSLEGAGGSFLWRLDDYWWSIAVRKDWNI